MAQGDPKTRYPLPDNPDVLPPFPETAWAAKLEPLINLNGYWLEVTCQCGRSTHIPFRVLVGQAGPHMTLGRLVDKLRCQESGCRQRPFGVRLTDRPGKRQNHGPAPRGLELL